VDIHNEFIAQEKDLVFYTGKPIINRVHRFYDINGDDWNFSAATAFTFKIWEEREGGLLMIDWSDTTGNLANTGNEITLNAPSTDTDIERGKYYYEMEYVIAGGYTILIAYGQAEFL
jgi:hypothetical protein